MKINKKSFSNFSFMIIWIAFTILTVTWGFGFVMPDLFYVNYGFPLVWATHTLSACQFSHSINEVSLGLVGTSEETTWSDFFVG